MTKQELLNKLKVMSDNFKSKFMDKTAFTNKLNSEIDNLNNMLSINLNDFISKYGKESELLDKIDNIYNTLLSQKDTTSNELISISNSKNSDYENILNNLSSDYALSSYLDSKINDGVLELTNNTNSNVNDFTTELVSKTELNTKLSDINNEIVTAIAKIRTDIILNGNGNKGVVNTYDDLSSLDAKDGDFAYILTGDETHPIGLYRLKNTVWIPNYVKAITLDELKALVEAIKADYNNKYLCYTLEYANVSHLTSLADLFHLFDFEKADVTLSTWDVSNVTNMINLFDAANVSNLDISNWDVSNVITMHDMFFEASNLNCSLAKWNTSNVADMGSTFMSTNFNPDISNWDVSNVKNMNSMFSFSDFNEDISNWDTRNVTDMTYMFKSTTNFNQDISNWNVKKIITHDDFNIDSKLEDINCPIWNAPYGDTVLFAGGYDDGIKDTIYKISLSVESTVTDFGNLTVPKYMLASFCNGTTALFAGGGSENGNVTDIDKVTIATNSNATDFGNLTAAVSYNAGTSDGAYGISIYGSSSINVVDRVVISIDSDATDFADMSPRKNTIDACSDGTNAYIGGGYLYDSGSYYYQNIVRKNIATGSDKTLSDFIDRIKKSGVGSASNKDIALFAGGAYNSDGVLTEYSIIEKLTFSNDSYTTEFGDLSVRTNSVKGSSNFDDIAIFIPKTRTGTEQYIMSTGASKSGWYNLETDNYGRTACSGN